MKKILIMTSESFPYQKAGGLADANADFSFAYKNFYPKDEISMILPFFGNQEPVDIIKKEGFELKKTNISYEYQYGINRAKAFIYEVINPYNNIPALFVYSDFSKCEKVYTGDIFKNSTSFMHAVLEYIKLKKEFCPDIIQTTDFPLFRELMGQEKPKIIHVIHNGAPPYQSITGSIPAFLSLASKEMLDIFLNKKELMEECCKLYEKNSNEKASSNQKVLSYICSNYGKLASFEENIKSLCLISKGIKEIFAQYLELDGTFNPIKQHIKSCDFWITDSPSYYNDIISDVRYAGSALFEAIVETKEKSTPVLAGVDPKRLEPLNSKNIFFNFGIDNFEEGKKKNREYLFYNFSKEKPEIYNPFLFSDKNAKTEGKLKCDKNSILIFMSSRADIFQKGIDTAFSAIDNIIDKENIQFIFSAPNSFKEKYIKSYIEYVKHTKKYKGRYVFIDSYIPNEMYCAGSDLFLMPSRFEPCGFSQLIAMRFGCIPVVSKTGGLNDTIEDYNQNENKGNGFKTLLAPPHSDFEEDYAKTLYRAIKTVKDKKIRNNIIKNTINYDPSWNKEKIDGYHKIYEKVLLS